MEEGPRGCQSFESLKPLRLLRGINIYQPCLLKPSYPSLSSLAWKTFMVAVSFTPSSRSPSALPMTHLHLRTECDWRITTTTASALMRASHTLTVLLHFYSKVHLSTLGEIFLFLFYSWPPHKATSPYSVILSNWENRNYLSLYFSRLQNIAIGELWPKLPKGGHSLSWAPAFLGRMPIIH